jgi:hypothetical protein
MSAEFECSIIAKLSGLGKDIDFAEKGSDETTPTACTHMYATIATANTAQALDLGDVSTVTMVILYAVDYDVLIDTSYSASFSTELTAKAAGIPAVIPYPGGTVYVQGETDQTPKFEYLVIGTT